MRLFFVWLTVFILIRYSPIFAQHGNFRIVEHQNNLHLQKISYQYSGQIQINPYRKVNTDTLQTISIGTLGTLQDYGKPALPSWTIQLIKHAEISQINFSPLQTDTIHNILIAPWIGMPVDLIGTPSPQFFMDSIFYQSDVWYPNTLAQMTQVQMYRDIPVAFIQICPFQFNPVQRKLIFYREFEIHITFDTSSYFKLNNVPVFIQRSTLNGRIFQTKNLNQPEQVLIFTIPQFAAAAKDLAQWHTQKGYRTKVIQRPWWSTNTLSQIIRDYYFSPLRPSAIIFLGDYQHVPGILYTTDFNIFGVDKPYGCMDGKYDYVPDIRLGRISVSTANEASNVVQKIIQYEKNPVSLSSFYQTAVCASYFQDDDLNGYEDRRFVRTAEEILQHLTSQYNKTVHRVYFTESNINPLYYNNDYFGAGEPLPSYLLKPQFQWDGSAFHIRSYINQGSFFVCHRDHGYDAGWAKPLFTITNINSLINNNRLPLVSSINCQTGKFIEPVCFAEAFQRHPNGGAIGVFAHAEVSYSGYNDALSLGVVDAMFPGLIPQFTGSAHQTDTIPPHQPILLAGDILNYATFFMSKAWGNGWGLEQYQYNIAHYFGDPTTQIFSTTPQAIQAIYPLLYSCSDTSITIAHCNVNNALATLSYEDHLIGSTLLHNGTGTIIFETVGYPSLTLTITAPNHQPLITTLTLKEPCTRAQINFEPTTELCINQPIRFVSQTSGFYTSLLWNFGSSALPSQSTEPVTDVIFQTAGWHTITLIAYSPTGNDTASINIFVDSLCSYRMPLAGLQVIQQCQGILTDNGGSYPYASGYQATSIIHSPGASALKFIFDEFHIQPSALCSSASLSFYKGLPEDSILIGQFCNSHLPPDTIIIPSDTVTIVFFAEENLLYEGFRLRWYCLQQHLPPVARAAIEPMDQCQRRFRFKDLSLHSPTHWIWNFGDGNISHIQHPVHEYSTPGTYQVTLIVTNQFGSDTLILSEIYIPPALLIPDTSLTVCTPQHITISSGVNSRVLWYNHPDELIPFAYEEHISLYVNDDTMFYCRYPEVIHLVHTALPDTSGPGGYLSSSTEHYLSFDVFKPFILKSVTVYAQDDGPRTITIRNAQNEIIFQQTYNLLAGKNVLIIDKLILPGMEYRISAGVQNKLWRNGSPTGNILYPIQLDGVLSINRSSADYPYALRYYYYFYDWQIALLCEGPPAQKEVKVLIPNTQIQAYPTTHLCTSEKIIIHGPPQYQYQWNSSSSPLHYLIVTEPGTYHATITVNNCTATTNSIIITGEQPPHALFTYDINYLTVTFQNLSNGNAFEWHFGDGNISYQTHPIHTYDTAGTYLVTLIALNECGSDTTSAFITVNEPIRIIDHSSVCVLYPNPASQYLCISCNEHNIEYTEILSTLGNVIIQHSAEPFSNTKPICIPVNTLKPGYYLLRIFSKDFVQWYSFMKM